jgi:signal transduction histidine kinase
MNAKSMFEADMRYVQKLAAVGRLAGGLAHEINTPIQFANDNLVFLGESMGQILHLCETYRQMFEKAGHARLSSDDLAEIRRTEEESDIEFLLSNMPRAIESALEGTMRVADISQSIGAFAHPTHEEPALVDIDAALRETLAIARNETKYVMTVETSFGDVPAVSCMSSDIKHVFLVLLTSSARAIKAAVGLGGTAVVRVETLHETEQVVVIVGHHVTAQSLANGAMDSETLSLVRSIVVGEHGGALAFEPQAGGGERVVVRLPIERPTSVARWA